MPEPTTEQKCPACGAPLRFDPETGKLVCDYCGTVTEIAPEEAQAAAENAETVLQGFDFNEILQNSSSAKPAELPIYNCRSCGAEIIADPETVSLTCPYCRNNIVLTQKVSGSLRPDAILPFKITPKMLPDVLTKFYADKKLLPKNFFTERTVGDVNGVYVPFWLFSGTVSGSLDYLGERVNTRTVGQYQITDTAHYRLSRNVSMSFDSLPLDAAEKIEDELMDSIQPYDYRELKPFDLRYLAGYTADRFDAAPRDIAVRAKERMVNSTQTLAGTEAGRDYLNVTPCGGNLMTRLSKVRYILLPVYLFKMEYKNKSYRFAVNGQTGKIIGELPVGQKEKASYFGKRAGIGAGIILLLSLLKYFFL